MYTYYISVGSNIGDKKRTTLVPLFTHYKNMRPFQRLLVLLDRNGTLGDIRIRSHLLMACGLVKVH